MSNIPVRFRRVAAAFEEEAARVRLCESSGSEHSPEEDFTDLSDLVNSFMERDDDAEVDRKKRNNKKKVEEGGGDGEELSESYWSNSENKDRLRSLLLGGEDGGDDGGSKRKIRAEAKVALQLIAGRARGFKRQLMSRLRDGGLDAGLCKSRWEKNGNLQAGSYEYVDVNINGTRYIVELHLAEEFSIARPTTSYDSLLDIFPDIFVGTVDELKQISRLMCAAAKESMKRMDMPMAPWRRNSYMQAKWASSYKRTTNAAPGGQESYASHGAKRSIGFVQVPPISYYCRDNLGSKIGGLRIGHLSAVLSNNSVGPSVQ